MFSYFDSHVLLPKCLISVLLCLDMMWTNEAKNIDEKIWKLAALKSLETEHRWTHPPDRWTHPSAFCGRQNRDGRVRLHAVSDARLGELPPSDAA